MGKVENLENIEKIEGYCTDIFFQEALGWIHEQKDKPFFAYIPTNAPHGPFVVGDDYREKYQGKVKDKNTASFFGMITNIDDNVGSLVKKLDEWGLADNTLLIFTTDNGSAKGSRIYNAGMKVGKNTVNEGGSRVPLFFRLPGTTNSGQEFSQLARHIDIFPTLADVAGADISDLKLEGRSLLPLIKDPKSQWAERHLYFHTGRWPKAGAGKRFGNGDPNPDSYKYGKFAVRNEKWRLVGKDRLYDIVNDPGEKNNVINDHPEVVAKLQKSYDKWWNSTEPLLVNENLPRVKSEDQQLVLRYEKQLKERGIPEWAPKPLQSDY